MARRLRRGFLPHLEGVITMIVLGALMIAIGIVLAGPEDRDSEAEIPAGSRLTDPLAAEFVRCNALGAAALDDAGCKAAWAENRRRFVAPAPAKEPRPAAQEAP